MFAVGTPEESKLVTVDGYGGEALGDGDVCLEFC